MTVTPSRAWLALTIAPALLLGACASSSPPTLEAAKGPPMAEETIGGRPTLIYRAPNADLRRYTTFIVDPVDIYRGTDGQFDNATEAAKQQMAQFMRSEFVRALGNRNATAPGPNVARLHLTLGGLENNVPGVATVTHVVPAGLVLNVINSASNNPGSFTGSVTIAGELRNSQTNALLVSFVQKRYPDAMDIGATLSSTDAQKAAITEAADGLRKRIDAVQSGQ
jgi:hypothetical protein